MVVFLNMRFFSLNYLNTPSLFNFSENAFRWNKYKDLWMLDKVAECEQFLSKHLPLMKIDEKFLFYEQIVDKLQATKPHHSIKAIRVNLKPLIQTICQHAIEWRKTLGSILAERTNREMNVLRDHITVLIGLAAVYLFSPKQIVFPLYRFFKIGAKISTRSQNIWDKRL